MERMRQRVSAGSHEPSSAECAPNKGRGPGVTKGGGGGHNDSKASDPAHQHQRKRQQQDVHEQQQAQAQAVAAAQLWRGLGLSEKELQALGRDAHRKATQNSKRFVKEVTGSGWKVGVL